MLYADIRPKGPKSFNMLVDWPKADVAASGQSHLSPFILSEKRSQKIVGSAYFLDKTIFNNYIVNCLS